MGDNKSDIKKEVRILTKERQRKDIQLLRLEYAFGMLGLVTFFAFILTAMPIVEINFPLAVTMFIIGFVIFLVAGFIGLKIEQVAGYYQCAECEHKYVPTFKAVFLAMHFGRTRYLRCPKCDKKSWQKKVV